MTADMTGVEFGLTYSIRTFNSTGHEPFFNTSQIHVTECASLPTRGKARRNRLAFRPDTALRNDPFSRENSGGNPLPHPR